MKISLITVTYNSEKYLEHCLMSVIKQTYKDIEHIIVDGNSTDNTLSIIERYSSHISHWISEKDRGMYDAINKGMKLATGDVIGVLNSDDVLASSDVISEIAKCFVKNKVESLYGDLEYVDQHDDEKVLRFWKGLDYKRKRFKFGWMPAHPTFYFKRELFERFGGYESHYFTSADYELMARYLFLNKVSSVYLPKLIVRMRKGGASNSSLPRRLRANRRDYLAMKKNKISFPFIISILKPVRKIPQYKPYLYNFFSRKKEAKVTLPRVILFPAE